MTLGIREEMLGVVWVAYLVEVVHSHKKVCYYLLASSTDCGFHAVGLSMCSGQEIDRWLYVIHLYCDLVRACLWTFRMKFLERACLLIIGIWDHKSVNQQTGESCNDVRCEHVGDTCNIRCHYDKDMLLWGRESRPGTELPMKSKAFSDANLQFIGLHISGLICVK